MCRPQQFVARRAPRQPGGQLAGADTLLRQRQGHQDPGLRWLGLDVKRHLDGGDGTAVVEFVARCKAGGARAVRMHEVSRFEWVDGRWLYVDGEFPR